MRLWYVTFCIAVATTWSAHAQPSKPPIYPVEVFAKLPKVMSPSLSPDGRSVAYLTAMTSGRKTLVAHPLNGQKTGRSFALPNLEKADIRWFRWANNERLLVSYGLFAENVFYGAIMEQTRLFSASFAGDVFNLVKPSLSQQTALMDDTDPLSAKMKVSVAQTQDRVVDFLPSDPNHILLSLDENLDGEPGVRRINVNDGSFDIIQNDQDNIWFWVSDANGEPALGWGWPQKLNKREYERKLQLFMRADLRGNWSEEAIAKLINNDFRPQEVLEDNVTALFSGPNSHGRTSIGVFDLRDGSLVRWLFSDETYDLTRLYRSSITSKINGSYYTDSLLRQTFVNGEEKRILNVIGKLLPESAVRILSSDRVGNLFLLGMSKPNETPKIFLFDLAAKQLNLFSNLYPDIPDDHVAPVSMHQVSVRDDLEIEVYITSPIGAESKALPTIVLPHGGPASRDSADFDAMAQLFANRGYRVLQPNFRGSSGYGVSFEDLGDQNWGRTMQEDLEDTVAWAAKTGLSDASRICIVGGSYGGYAALMGAVKTPELYQCAVSWNGVADLAQLWTDDGRFRGGREWRKTIALERGDTKDISPFHRAKEIQIPVLLIHAKDDARVKYTQSKSMYRRLKKLKKPVKYLELSSGGHTIDVDAERVRFMKAMIKFVEANLGQGKSVH